MDQSIEVAGGKPRKDVWIGWVLALSATFGFSFAPTLTRGALLSGMAPSSLLFARMLLACALLGLFIAVTLPDRLRIDRRGLLFAALAGVGNGAGFILFFLALTRLSASVASMIFSLYPLAVLSLLALRGEPFTRRNVVRLSLGLAGVYLLIGPSGRVDVAGALLVIGAIFFFAGQMVIAQWYLREYHTWTITFYVNLTILLISFGWWLLSNQQWHDPGAQGWAYIVTLAVVSTFIARFALYGGMQYLGSGQVSLTVPLETLLSVTWSMVFLHEKLFGWQWAGAVFILASMTLAIQRLRFARRSARWRAWSRP